MVRSIFFGRLECDKKMITELDAKLTGFVTLHGQSAQPSPKNTKAGLIYMRGFGVHTCPHPYVYIWYIYVYVYGIRRHAPPPQVGLGLGT